MAIRAVLFDMDGTLINVLDLWRGLLACYLTPLGAELSEAQFREAMTLSYDHLAVYLQETCALSKTPREIMEEIDHLSMTEYAKRATLKPGVAAYIKSLYEQGLTLAIVTTNLGEIAKDVLRHFSLSDYFSAVYGTYELAAGKSEPECFLDIADRLGVPPGECLVLEDSPHAAKSAKRAGMKVIGVLGEQPDAVKEELITIVDKTIDSYYERMDLPCKKSE